MDNPITKEQVEKNTKIDDTLKIDELIALEKTTPNDTEFGTLVRKLINDYK